MSDNPTPEESQAKLFGMDISLRGWLALSLVLTLCVITFNDPDMYADTFKITVTSIVSFYFGQNSKK